MLAKRSIIKLSAVSLFVATGLFFSFIQEVPTKPDESRFTAVELTQPGDLDEPNTFEVLKDGRVLISERKGAVKLYDPITKTIKVVATIPVNTKYTDLGNDKAANKGKVSEAEEGLLGLTVDPAFATNHWVYTFYSHPTQSKFQLTRWNFANDQLVAGSEKVLLEFPTQREICCHTGGGMTWDKKGNLYITVGNNTASLVTSTTDQRPNRSSWDDQRGTSNTNSLIGKILRIHPEPNGTYTIPAGNLFPKGTALTRPEIYTMGHRNPWRPSIDTKTGWLYWGDVGPDGTQDMEIYPRGYDELNQARKPGFYGWPYFTGKNVGYPIFDYESGEAGPAKDPLKPINNSVNNTGLKELPPAQVPLIAYPYAASEEFPLVGSGSRSAVGGPIYHRADFPTAKRPWPAYYEGKWLAADLARGWIMAITMDGNGDYKAMEKFLPTYKPVEPIDLKFGPDGDLYVLEYGSTWFAKSASAKLVRVEFNAGNRKPAVEISANKAGGTVPLKLTLSSAGSKDPDGDALKYSWKITSPGVPVKVFSTANPVVTFDKPGVYMATLTVTDPKGLANSKSLSIIAGNEPPVVKVNLTSNKTFFFDNKPIGYSVSVEDAEDGTISPSQVAVSIDYASQGFDYASIIQGQRSVDASTQFAVAQALMAKSDCKNCHSPSAKNIGPSFTQIAEKYQGNEIDRLATKIITGGSGVWATAIGMPAHPAISQNDAHNIVKYIMNINTKTISTLPLQGSYAVKIPQGDDASGSYIIRAAYTDKGNKTVPQQTAQNTIILRSPVVNPADADIKKDATVRLGARGAAPFTDPRNNGHIAFKQIDLTGIKQLEITAISSIQDSNPGGKIEVRLDSPTGALLGQTEVASAEDGGRAAGKPALKVDVKETAGMHDLYFVFKNDSAKPIATLFSLTSIKFNDEKK
jgi:cytochrome c